MTFFNLNLNYSNIYIKLSYIDQYVIMIYVFFYYKKNRIRMNE